MASQDSEGAFSEKHSLVFGDFILGFKNSSSRKGVWRWPPRGCRLQAPSPQPGETWAAAMRKAAAAGRGGGVSPAQDREARCGHRGRIWFFR